MRRNLVTGGAGFVGRHLVAALLVRGERVAVLDLHGGGFSPEVEFIQGSVLDPGCVRRALKGIDRLYHLAANPNLWTADARDFFKTNLDGTRIVLAEAAFASLERIVYTSTESILKSRHRNSGLIRETVALGVGDMIGAYCRSKFLAEECARDAARRGLPVVIVNPTLPIGPGDAGATPPGRMLLGFLTGKNPAFLECRMNLIDVRDVATGHILAAQSGHIGERYILGNANMAMSEILALLEDVSGRPMPKRQVPYWLALAVAGASEAISRLTKSPPLAPLAGVRLARSPMIFDNAKAVAELGLELTPLRTTFSDTVAWFDKSGFLR
jgi:dihydroflavonol-4-reductase